MRVLILGAGASKRAGYPLAGELLEVVAREAKETSSLQFRDAWRRWEQFREQVPAPLRLIAYNSNPEVVLSLPDLYAAAAESEDDERTSSAVRRYLDTGEADAAELEAYFNSAERDALSEALPARARLLDALEWYFWGRHHEDAAERSRRDYLRPLMDSLSDGDIVVTLNWDTVVERTLAEAGRWNPSDGYGFPRELAIEDSFGRSPLPPEFPSESSVQVLKLHGSFGWRSTDVGMYLDATMLLREFDFQMDVDPVRLIDSDAPEFYAPDPGMMAYPSFLKRLDHPILETIWRTASEALARAESVVVWGYSLPESDAAIRALLQGLSARVRRGEAEAVVHDPSQRVLRRWRALLGEQVELRREEL